jgi:hypothetical protein
MLRQSTSNTRLSPNRGLPSALLGNKPGVGGEALAQEGKLRLGAVRDIEFEIGADKEFGCEIEGRGVKL